MLFLILFNLFYSTITFSAIDTGNGSDGGCTQGTFNTNTNLQSTYNCSTLILGTNLSVTGAAVLIIKVQNTVVINGGVTLSINGEPGSSAGAFGFAGAGGNNGGECTANTCGIAPDTDGIGTGKGLGGLQAFDVSGGASDGGGGGAGGSYGTIGTAGATGTGTEPGSGGSVSATYGSEANFETTLTTGSSGGAGGSGDNNGGARFFSGGGGGSGGSIWIRAGGSITINGFITSNGGNGGSPGVSLGGGGGGGSGGTIFLQSESTITNAGTISATGGTGGTGGAGMGAGTGGNGGNGGNGRIRLDDLDGVIANTGTITPSAYTSSITSNNTSTTAKPNFDSSITCARVNHENILLYLVAFIFLVSLIPNFSNRKPQN
jgi:hypothetical protein